MVVYGGRPPRRPRGRRRLIGWLPRWARWTLGVLGGLVLLAAAGVYYEYNKVTTDISRMTQVPKSDRKASKDLQTLPGAGQPITALVIGSDHRANGATGKNGLSDTQMLVRMDPAHHMISMLSIPRDLWVDVPGHGYSKMNAAYSEGGNTLVLQTVEQVTGVRPNYLINVDFAGFRSLVDKLGGIYINVDQYYYNPPSLSQSDGFSEIDIKPGYQLLNGTDALAFSRYRHSDDDFHRQARQQTFLRAFEGRAAARFRGISVLDLPFINDMLDAISHAVTIVGPHNQAPSFATMRTFASTAYESRGRNVSVRMPWALYAAPDGESAVTIAPSAIQAGVYQWKHPWTVATAGASLPKVHHPTHHWKPAVAPATVAVSVLNGNGTTGAAGTAAGQLRAWHYRAAAAGNAPGFRNSRTWVYYRSSAKRAAADLVRIFGSGATASAMPPVIAARARKAAIAVVVGKPYTGRLAVQAPVVPKPPPPPATISPTTEYRADFLPAQRLLSFQVLYPTVAQADSSFCPWVPQPYSFGSATCQGATTTGVRVYNIPAAGSGPNSMYAVFYDANSNGYWGIEETRFAAAPILANANAVRRLDGRNYQFYYNGSHIQTIGFVEHGIAYWVSNALMDDLTNQEMLAIARSLQPVR